VLLLGLSQGSSGGRSAADLARIGNMAQAARVTAHPRGYLPRGVGPGAGPPRGSMQGHPVSITRQPGVVYCRGGGAKLRNKDIHLPRVGRWRTSRRHPASPPISYRRRTPMRHGDSPTRRRRGLHDGSPPALERPSTSRVTTTLDASTAATLVSIAVTPWRVNPAIAPRG